MEVFCATSSSVEHPASAMLDGDPRTFFATTGCFPQEVVFRLSGKTSLARLKVVSTGIKRFAVDRCDGASVVTWQQFVESEVGEPDALQTTNLATPPTPATFLRLRILAGYKEFVTIRSFEAQLAS